MRYPIWKRDDFFEIGGKRIDVDPSVVELPMELDLVWQYNWSDVPRGKVTDIRLEDGEITGEVEFLDEWLNEKMMEDFNLRLGGYYTDVIYEGDAKTRVVACTLRGVGTMLPSDVAGNPKI